MLTFAEVDGGDQRPHHTRRTRTAAAPITVPLYFAEILTNNPYARNSAAIGFLTLFTNTLIFRGLFLLNQLCIYCFEGAMIDHLTLR